MSYRNKFREFPRNKFSTQTIYIYIYIWTCIIKEFMTKTQNYVKLLTNRNGRLILQPHQTRDNEPVSQH